MSLNDPTSDSYQPAFIPSFKNPPKTKRRGSRDPSNGGVARLYLDGHWDAEEFENLFRYFNDLYSLLALFTDISSSAMLGAFESSKNLRFSGKHAFWKTGFPGKHGTIKELDGSLKAQAAKVLFSEKLPLDRRRIKRLMRSRKIICLFVLEIAYASPGFTDIAGIGKIAEVAKETAFGIADRINQAEDRKLEQEKKKIENSELRSSNERKSLKEAAKVKHAREIHRLEISKRSIENRRLQEALRADELNNALLEIRVIKEMMEACNTAGIDEAARMSLLQTLLKRTQPIAKLVREHRLSPLPNQEHGLM